MESIGSRGSRQIAEILLAAKAAIRASPCTCARFDPEDIASLVIENGLDPQTRIPRFNELHQGARAAYYDAVRELTRNPQKQAVMESANRDVFRLSPKNAEPANHILNCALEQCGLSDAAQGLEKVSVAYSASVNYAWTTASELNRKIRGRPELDDMLKSGLFRSINHGFVATSLTGSPFLRGRRVDCTIRITDTYRRHAMPLTYTAIFRCELPEIFGGLKNAGSLEDEVRIMNGTPIEKGTVDMTFYCDDVPPASSMDEIQTRYAELGKVSFKPRSDARRGAAVTHAKPSWARA